MGKRERFLDPIPDEYQIFEQRLEVVGIQHRKKAAQRFATGNQQRLKLKPEPSNEYDPNAISVIGVWKDSSGQERTAHIGYLNKNLARVLTRSGYAQRVLARLESIFQNERDNTWIGVDFQLLGPKGELQKYEQLPCHRPLSPRRQPAPSVAPSYPLNRKWPVGPPWLVPCRECEKEISDKAPVCPHCGAYAPLGSSEWYAWGKDGVYKTYYYPSGKLEWWASFSDMERYGPYELYYENGQLQQKGTYKAGVLDGPFESYDENGQLVLKGTYSADRDRGHYYLGHLYYIVPGYLGQKCGEWFENGETVTYDPCPPDLEDGN